LKGIVKTIAMIFILTAVVAIVANIAWVLVDVLTFTGRLSTIQTQIQEQVARNNGLSTEAADMFNRMLADIDRKSVFVNGVALVDANGYYGGTANLPGTTQINNTNENQVGNQTAARGGDFLQDFINNNSRNLSDMINGVNPDVIHFSNDVFGIDTSPNSHQYGELLNFGVVYSLRVDLMSFTPMPDNPADYDGYTSLIQNIGASTAIVNTFTTPCLRYIK
jgi:hypothetical protein